MTTASLIHFKDLCIETKCPPSIDQSPSCGEFSYPISAAAKVVSLGLKFLVSKIKSVQVVVDIDGDGSFLMNCQELATAAIEKMEIKMFILNNQHLGMVVQWEDRFYKANRAHTYLGNRVHPPQPNHSRRLDYLVTAVDSL